MLTQRGIHAHIDSAGIYTTFLGHPPDRRMAAVATSHGITLDHVAKTFENSFFTEFDLILCVTNSVLEAVRAMAHTKEHQSKLFLATHFSKEFKDVEIPDPYFRGKQGFERIWEIMLDACEGIISHFFLDHSKH